MLTRRRFSGWREIQNAYDDYMASLGPWTADEIGEDYFAIDYGLDDERWPVSRARLAAFFASDDEELRAT